jgi:hypothetical protein
LGDSADESARKLREDVGSLRDLSARHRKES